MAVDVQSPQALGAGIVLDWRHLIEAARILAGVSGAGTAPGRPRQAMLKRAVSTAYYAMFHALCVSNADALVGASPTGDDFDLWVQTFRALDHGQAKNRLLAYRQQSSTSEISEFARAFGNLQERRLAADYNPRSVFTRSQVVSLIDLAEVVTQAFDSLTPRQRRLLATHLLVGRSRS